ncbi:hypothetical protein ACN27F_05735 [Solwaraspora sp. WMMB335]|uniref:hypothetical protein n=1 Tax=Solwaraspora sp. WMMB335 TaxID=3404118 RepID=UPI003B9671A6
MTTPGTELTVPGRELTVPGRALTAMLGRLSRIEAAVGERFPLYADPATGQWASTRRGSWTGGFWAGLRWLAAAVDADPAERTAAATVTGRLLPRAADDTITRAMIFWYGAGATGGQLCADDEAAAAALTGARALATSFDGRLGVFPVGSAFGGSTDEPRLGVDALAAVVALMCWADQSVPGAQGLAGRHAATCRRMLVAPDGQVCAERALPARLPPPVRDRVWARGHAWGMLGFAVAAERLGDGFLDVALRTADWWLASVPTQIPLAVLGRPDAPPDTSAAAIAAAALWTLGGLPVAAAVRYRTAAAATVARLIDDHLSRDGVLRDGCYDLTGALACRHELIWGSYFLAGLLAVTGGAVSEAIW